MLRKGCPMSAVDRETQPNTYLSLNPQVHSPTLISFHRWPVFRKGGLMSTVDRKTQPNTYLSLSLQPFTSSKYIHLYSSGKYRRPSSKSINTMYINSPSLIRIMYSCHWSGGEKGVSHSLQWIAKQGLDVYNGTQPKGSKTGLTCFTQLPLNYLKEGSLEEFLNWQAAQPTIACDQRQHTHIQHVCFAKVHYLQ